MPEALPLEIRDVARSFGEILALLGTNGAGKTTLVLSVVGKEEK